MDDRSITDEVYRYGYQGQYAEKNDSTGWNEFQLRMYDARFGRWLSVDPYGQFWSPYVGMGNIPHMGTDPDGGYWVTALAGAVVGGAIGYIASDGDWRATLAGAVAGGLIGASFERVPVYAKDPHYALRYITGHKLVLSPFGAGIVNGVEGLFMNIPTNILDEVVVTSRAPRVSGYSYKPKGLDSHLSKPDLSKIVKPQSVPVTNELPCPELGGVSMRLRGPTNIATGYSTLQGIANHLRNGGRVKMTYINTGYSSTGTTKKEYNEGSKPIGADPISTFDTSSMMWERLRLINRTLHRMGAPRNSLNTRNVKFNYDQSNENIGFECY